MTDSRATDVVNDCSDKQRHADPAAELRRIHNAMHAGKPYSFEQSLLCDLLKQLERLAEFERPYREIEKLAAAEGVDVMVHVNRMHRKVEAQRKAIGQMTANRDRLKAQLQQHAETCKESAWPLGEPK